MTRFAPKPRRSNLRRIPRRFGAALASLLMMLGSAGDLRAQSTEPVAWTNLVKAAAVGNRITKTEVGAGGWNAGGTSTKGLSSGDGYVEITPVAGHVMVGLATGDASLLCVPIDATLKA